MSHLFVVNPDMSKTKTKGKAKKKPAQSRAASAKPAVNPKKGAKMAKKGKMPEGLRKYWAAVRAGKKHPKKNPTHHAKAHHAGNPTHHAKKKHYKRNPAPGGFFGELMSKEGLLMIAAVAGTPTALEFGVNLVMPNANGYIRSGVKAAIGVGLGFGIYKFVNKKMGALVAAASIGAAAIEAFHQFQLHDSLDMAATKPAGELGGYVYNEEVIPGEVIRDDNSTLTGYVYDDPMNAYA